MTRLTAAVVLLSAVVALPAARQGGRSNQPTPALSVEEVILAADRLRADRWYPEGSSVGESGGERLNRGADMDLLLLAARHPLPALRYFAVREFGRFETPANVAFLTAFLDDPEVTVRRGAANALVQSVFGRLEATAEAAMAVAAIEERLKREVHHLVRGDLYRRLAELPLPPSVAVRYEREWLTEIEQLREFRDVAAEALLRLAQTQAGRPFDSATEAAVERWAQSGLGQGAEWVMAGTVPRGRTLHFLQILQAIRNDNDMIAVEAAAFSCKVVAGAPPSNSSLPCGTEIRELGVQLLNPHNPRHLAALERAARNRVDANAASAAIRKLLRAPGASMCHLLDLADGLPAERDIVAALDRTDPGAYEACSTWDPVVRLMDDASALEQASPGATWILPATALETLARRFVATREDGKRLEALHTFNADVAARHVRWEVRATAARVAKLLDQVGVLTRLADDDHPNVQADVITSLVALNNPLRWEVAIKALTTWSDAHLTIIAAGALRGVPQVAAARDALVTALARLTREGHDTSRRARLALIDRLIEVTPHGAVDSDAQVQPLRVLLTDYDPIVAAAAADAVSRITGSPVYARPTRRATKQPTVGQISAIPPCISFDLEGETLPVTVLLSRLTAPVAIARVTELIDAGYYNRTTMHFVDENVARGGNPAGNDEGGIPRFIRDEVGGGASRLTGMPLVLVAHDRDTADGRLMFGRVPPDHSRLRRETVLGWLLTPRMLPMGTVTRVWLGAPDSLRPSCDSSQRGIPPIGR